LVQVAIAVAAAATIAAPHIGLVITPLIAGCARSAVFDSRRHGVIDLALVFAGLFLMRGFELFYANSGTAPGIPVLGGIAPGLFSRASVAAGVHPTAS